MAKTYPTASISVSFQTKVVDADGNVMDKDAHLHAEVVADDNNGKTNFFFGDTAKYRVYKTPNITSLTVIVTDGSEGALSSGHTEKLVETVAFNNADTANVSKYLYQLLSATQMGNRSLGSISKVGATTVRCSKQSTGPLDPLVGVYKIEYNTQYALRKLFGVSEPAGFGVDGFDSYPVVVYLVGTVA